MYVSGILLYCSEQEKSSAGLLVSENSCHRNPPKACVDGRGSKEVANSDISKNGFIWYCGVQ